MQGIAESVAVIGCGTMGQAIVRGLLERRALDPERLRVTIRSPEAVERLRQTHGITVGSDNLAACQAAEVVLVCLKPQQVAAALDPPEIKAALQGKLVISIAAGVRLAQLAALLPGSALVRAMPNTPCLIGEGMTVIARGARVTDAQASTTRSIFSAVGRCMELEEKHLDAVTSLNSSGPAFAYVILESLADGGVMMGLPRSIAIELAAQMFQGAARMVLATGLHPAALKDQVTTPAGCTIAGLLTLEDGKIRSVLARAVEQTARVAGRLGQE